MRLAVMSDLHVMGPGEAASSLASAQALGSDDHPMRRRFRRGLNRIRDRFWHWDPHSREACFHHALEVVADYHPDFLVLNGDYGGDHEGVGLSDDHTFASAAMVIAIIRETFADRARFVFGDHDIGKYNTIRGRGGIRLHSLRRGEENLGIQSFWHVEHEAHHLIGVNSSLLSLGLFLPEALGEEVDDWRRLREEHLARVIEVFEGMPSHARIILFCHDPSALAVLGALPEVRRRQSQILRTVVGHLHTPGLLALNRLVGRLPAPPSNAYPIARIVSEGARGARAWKAFHPVVCPSTFGVGNHIDGGVLFLESGGPQGLRVERRHIRV
jgi:hypothetical protein